MLCILSAVDLIEAEKFQDLVYNPLGRPLRITLIVLILKFFYLKLFKVPMVMLQTVPLLQELLMI